MRYKLPLLQTERAETSKVSNLGDAAKNAENSSKVGSSP